MKKNNYCECGKLIYKESQKCHSCASKGKNNGNFKGGKDIKCKECNNLFFVNLYFLNRGRKFCSSKCRKIYWKKHGKYQIHTCKLCHKKFKFHPGSSKGIFCSLKCKKTNDRIFGFSKETIHKMELAAQKIIKKRTPAEYLEMCKRNRITAKKRTKTDKHHIDLNKKNNRKSNILILLAKEHHSLHARAYNYLVKIRKVRDYIKWFKHLQIKEVNNG